MRIQEVENFCTVFQRGGNLLPSPDNALDIYLSNDGDKMNVKVNSALATGHVRRIELVYMKVDMMNNSFSRTSIGIVGPLTSDDEYHEFDISYVKQIPLLATKAIMDNSISIDLFSYESNTVTGYGSRRLSYPSRLNNESTITVPSSTDGWYQLYVLDVPVWSGANEYVAGDIVYHNESSSFARASISNVAIPPNNPDETWSPVTNEQWILYSIAIERVSTYDASLRISADLLVSRNVKQTYILRAIKESNFDSSDDDEAMEALSRISALREAAIACLEAGDPIKSLVMLYRIPGEYNNSMNHTRPIKQKNNYRL
jgi:hypothetical protein